ncbi:hypothetical protein LSH36_13g14027 [Paralvinella palmiformis]|uniref:Fucosyltransferase n=1 Tax=Paralvinella palmiformis TaxID=53620 RepID=A0AAD9NIZ9_9ANNE|nr:hypothetical protein LSH36_13g14027 [Paralvinella palmiformis]
MATRVQSAGQKRRSYCLSYFISLCDVFYGRIFEPEIFLVLVILIVLFIVIWHHVLSIFVGEMKPTSIELLPSQPDGPGNRLEGYKFILIWSGCFGVKDCGWGGSSYFFANIGCPEERCMVITDRNQLARADVVVFHVRDMRFVLFTLDVPSHRDPDQVWVFFTHESPYNTYVSSGFLPTTNTLTYLDGMFNATMTYMRESDFFLPYISYSPINRSLESYTVVPDKSRQVLWLVSNCKSDSRRSEYVVVLKQYIQVDVYGNCGKADPCRGNATCSNALIEQYKFYLAFENAECRDYVTEKFWRSLRHGVVPVVLGATVAEYEALAPPNSFLHVDNFTSIRSLADYLLYLDRNPAAYGRYLEWRRHFEISSRASDLALCRMCSVAHNKSLLRRQSYKISEWYSVKRLCRKTDRTLS